MVVFLGRHDPVDIRKVLVVEADAKSRNCDLRVENIRELRSRLEQEVVMNHVEQLPRENWQKRQFEQISEDGPSLQFGYQSFLFARKRVIPHVARLASGEDESDSREVRLDCQEECLEGHLPTRMHQPGQGDDRDAGPDGHDSTHLSDVVDEREFGKV